jgi:hypothetical protein
VKSKWWTRSRTGGRFASSGFSESTWSETVSRPPPDPHGVVLSCEVHSENRSRAFGLRHPPCRFDDFAVFRSPPGRCRSTHAFHGLGSPSGFTGSIPPKSPDFSNPPEVLRPYSDISAGGPQSRVSTPGTFRLQGFSPSGRFPPSGTFRSRGSEPLMGFTLQSFSPSRSRTPFGAVALLSFLISRSSALRTRGSRYPATPGRSSPRGSVSRPGPEGQGGTDALLGLSPLQSQFPANRVAGFPAPSFLRFLRPFSEETERPALQGLTDLRVGPTLAGRTELS